LVGDQELVEELAHPLGCLDVRVGLGDVLGLLHPCPRQEEREVLVDVPDRDHQVLAGLRVDSEQLGVVGDDHEAGAVPHDGRGRLQLVDHRERVVGGLLEVDDVPLCDLGRLSAATFSEPLRRRVTLPWGFPYASSRSKMNSRS